MKIRMAVAGCAALVIGVAGAAGAYTIDYSQLTVGHHSITNEADGWTATALPSLFEVKGAQGGYQGVGVKGKTNGEIDINEFITFQFGTPQVIKDFTLSLLFAKGDLARGPYGDPNEIALVTANNGAVSYMLQAIGPATAIWTGHGSYDFLGNNATLVGDAAAWKVTNPFGDLAVTSLEFTALQSLGGFGNDSDYAFNSLNTATPVPEPVTILFLGVGVAGLVLVRRRLKT
jgi:hypothetical protein